MPGFGLPLDHKPPRDACFPVLEADDDSWKASTLLNREVCMLELIEGITNKPEWWRKVRDPEIAAKWKKEALEMPWAEHLRHADFTPNMADYVRLSSCSSTF